MKLIVTGGAGFIGSAVVRQAIGAGHDVLNIDKLTYAPIWKISPLSRTIPATPSPKKIFATRPPCAGWSPISRPTPS